MSTANFYQPEPFPLFAVGDEPFTVGTCPECGNVANYYGTACGVNPAYLMDACRACEAVGGSMRLEITGETSPIHVRAVNGKRGTFRGVIMPLRLDY